MTSDKPCKVYGSFERYDNAPHKCVPCNRERGRKYYAANPARGKANAKNYREANKEKIREQKRLDVDRRRAWQKAWRERNAERVRCKEREWCAANVERGMFRRAKERAKKLGLDFNLDVSDIVIPKICPLLGIVLERKPGVQADSTPSLDRIDSSLGYVKGNVWVISWRANNIKSDASLEELEMLLAGLERARRLRLVVG
ncbi:MAG TPA: hypothetical protein VNV25_25380 [Gemmatimonadaceae bacterium]|jgi:hypothetical protein|nr:hypothetical protein [Gemmatimonadaceae bacterium]